MAIYTPERLATLEKAYATGARTVSYDGKQVTYRNLDVMERILQKMRDERDGTTTTGASVATFSKGTA